MQNHEHGGERRTNELSRVKPAADGVSEKLSARLLVFVLVNHAAENPYLPVGEWGCPLVLHALKPGRIDGRRLVAVGRRLAHNVARADCAAHIDLVSHIEMVRVIPGGADIVCADTGVG